MRIYLTLCCTYLLLSFQVAFGQSGIRGTIKDGQGQPMMFANVLLLQQTDSSLVKGVVSDVAGKYSFSLVKAGNYLVAGSMIGYKTVYSSPLVIKDGLISLDDLILQEEAKQLGEVVVEVRKPLFEQQIDRLVVNVQSSITASSGTALQVLERSPGVMIDHYNSAISMNGKNGVQVMINGKLSRMPMESLYQMLSSMPAANIVHIELITTPPANLDAEGNAGYINIVLRRNEGDGLNGSFNIGAEKRRRFSSALGADINFRKNRFSLFASYAFTDDNRMMYADITRQMNFPNYQFDFTSRADRKGGADAHNFRLGIDYQLSAKTVVGVLTTIFDRNWSQTTDMHAQFKLTPGTDSLMNGFRKDKNLSEQYMANINLKHNFSDKHQLNLDLDYFYNHSNSPQNYVFDYYIEGVSSRQNQIRISKDTPMDIWVAKADYNLFAGKRLSIETGVKATYSSFFNDVLLENQQGEEWLMDPAFSEKASMDEIIGAAYGSFSLKINETTDLKAGLRYEYTDTKLISESVLPITRRYGSLFPTLFFSRKLNNHNTWQFSYNRRISRPAFSELAPFVLFLDPVTFLTGNSFLWPSFTHAVKTDFNHKGVIFSLQASRARDAIYGFQPQANPDNNVTVYSSLNIDREDTYVFSLTLPLSIVSWWEVQNNLQAMLQRVETQLDEGSYKFTRSSLGFNSSHSFKLPKKFSLELSGFYNSPAINGIRKVSAIGAVNIGLRKELSNNRGRLSLSLSDIFRNNIWLWEANLPEQQLSELMRFDIDAKSIKLTYTRTFGSQQVKGARKRTTGSAEEQKRL